MASISLRKGFRPALPVTLLGDLESRRFWWVHRGPHLPRYWSGLTAAPFLLLQCERRNLTFNSNKVWLEKSGFRVSTSVNASFWFFWQQKLQEQRVLRYVWVKLSLKQFLFVCFILFLPSCQHFLNSHSAVLGGPSMHAPSAYWNILHCKDQWQF